MLEIPLLISVGTYLSGIWKRVELTGVTVADVDEKHIVRIDYTL